MTAASEYYDEDEGISKSPGLQAIHVKAKPSPSPPPFIPTPRVVVRSPPADVSTNSSRSGKRANRRPKVRASQGDAVLINFLGNSNHPEVARSAGERPLNSASDSEDDEMEVDVHGSAVSPGLEPGPRPPAQNDQSSNKLRNIAFQTIQLDVSHENLPEARKDSAVSTSPEDLERKGSVESSRHRMEKFKLASPPSRDFEPQNPRFSSIDESVRQNYDAGTSSIMDSRRPSRIEQPEGVPPEDSINDSPRLRKHAISPSQISPRQTLPAMQDANSPNSTRTLPSFQQLSELADVAGQDHEARSNSISNQHRPSTSASTHSAIAQSPNQIPPQSFRTNTQRRSPPFGPTLSSHTSPPASANSISDPSPADSTTFSIRREYTSLSPPSAGAAPPGQTTFFFPRPQSQATDSHSSSVPSSSAVEGYSSTSESFSPAGHTPVEHRINLNQNPRPNLTLPPPIPQTSIGAGLPSSGIYRCDHPGCTAAPFQTQYLLK
ncbi:MAG: hypothetical protein M1820_006069 [Bogoriella megaspora]|nr:MAG: hypothetical protein M1820_006069 [Bogoriella megaspora]